MATGTEVSDFGKPANTWAEGAPLLLLTTVLGLDPPAAAAESTPTLEGFG